jgi:hypothetical protein
VVRAGLNYRFAEGQPSPNASAATPFGDRRVTIIPTSGRSASTTARAETHNFALTG